MTMQIHICTNPIKELESKRFVLSAKYDNEYFALNVLCALAYYARSSNFLRTHKSLNSAKAYTRSLTQLKMSDSLRKCCNFGLSFLPRFTFAKKTYVLRCAIRRWHLLSARLHFCPIRPRGARFNPRRAIRSTSFRRQA